MPLTLEELERLEFLDKHIAVWRKKTAEVIKQGALSIELLDSFLKINGM